MSNVSKRFIIYGIGVYFFTQRPKISLIGSVKGYALAAKTKQIMPENSVTCLADCNGLSRGEYGQLFVSQNTIYPFGLLEKYKYSKLDCGVLVLPAIDEPFSKELAADIRKQITILGSNREFFCHRPYIVRDSMRIVDWKKSANKVRGQWVTKEFRSNASVNRVLIYLDRDLAKNASDLAEYESYLSRVRTAIFVVRNWDLPVGLTVSGEAATWNYGKICSVLAGLPVFNCRHDELNQGFESEGSLDEDWILYIGMDTWHLSNARAKTTGSEG
jgi:hypothetical protein